MSWRETFPGLAATDPDNAAFADPRDEARAALEETVASPLLHLGTLVASGPETADFLQGQLSNDVRALGPGTAQLTSFNSPKGRVLAVMHAWRSPERFFLEMHSSMVEATLKRLRMYVLRAKTALEDASHAVGALGVAGPEAAARLADVGLPAPEKIMGCTWVDDGCVIRRHDAGAVSRYSIHAPPDRLHDVWRQLSGNARPVGTAAWRLLDIEAGVPTIYPATSDRFVAQMCNLDKLGGISFDKGCYTGQEVIARVYYRGAVKRHMTAIHHPDPALKPGARLDDPAGAEVVVAAPTPDGESRALVVASGG